MWARLAFSLRTSSDIRTISTFLYVVRARISPSHPSSNGGCNGLRGASPPPGFLQTRQRSVTFVIYGVARPTGVAIVVYFWAINIVFANNGLAEDWVSRTRSLPISYYLVEIETPRTSRSDSHFRSFIPLRTFSLYQPPTNHRTEASDYTHRTQPTRFRSTKWSTSSIPSPSSPSYPAPSST